MTDVPVSERRAMLLDYMRGRSYAAQPIYWANRLPALYDDGDWSRCAEKILADLEALKRQGHVRCERRRRAGSVGRWIAVPDPGVHEPRC